MTDDAGSTPAQEEQKDEKPTREPLSITITDIEMESLKNELSACKDKYLRVLAESENARKRLQKERMEMIQYAQENIICDFLTPIDQFENAMRFADKISDEVKQWSIGFRMILDQFKGVLSTNGVQNYQSVGTTFDPHLHEAVEMVVTTDQPDNTVVEENLCGYKMGDRIIRAARVKVAKAPPTSGSTTVNQSSEPENAES